MSASPHFFGRELAAHAWSASIQARTVGQFSLLLHDCWPARAATACARLGCGDGARFLGHVMASSAAAGMAHPATSASLPSRLRAVNVCECVRMCVCARARACVRVCVRACVRACCASVMCERLGARSSLSFSPFVLSWGRCELCAGCGCCLCCFSQLLLTLVTHR